MRWYPRYTCRNRGNIQVYWMPSSAAEGWHFKPDTSYCEFHIYVLQSLMHFTPHNHLHLTVFILTAGKCCDYCDFPNHRGFTIVCCVRASYILVAALSLKQVDLYPSISCRARWEYWAPVRANKIVPALWDACLQGEPESKIALVTFPPVVNNHFVDLGHDYNPST